jgi:glycosyltransferase involved in cell wall biosynthesis
MVSNVFMAALNDNAMLSNIDYSCVIPTTLNRKVLLRRAITSVAAQLLQPRQLLLVIDKLCDDQDYIFIDELINEFYLLPITVLFTGGRAGGGAARNIGIEASFCRYISFLDDDDEWSPSKAYKQIMALEQDARLLLCTCSRYLKKDHEQILQNCTDELVSRAYLYENVIGSFSFVTIRKTHRRINPILPACQDWDFWMQHYQDDRWCICIPEALATFHLHNGPRISNNYEGLLLGYNYFMLRWTEVRTLENIALRIRIYVLKSLQGYGNATLALEFSDVLLYSEGLLACKYSRCILISLIISCITRNWGGIKQLLRTV